MENSQKQNEEVEVLDPQEKGNTFALCMIVKDEAQVILRALKSVSEIVTYYCICDTGSTDGTQQIIRDYLEENNLEGVVYDRPWVNFAHNRTEAFQYAKGKADYLMTLDADEVLAPFIDGKAELNKKVNKISNLQTDKVLITSQFDNTRYYRAAFFRDGLDWRWEHPVHEYPTADDMKTISYLGSVCHYVTKEGARAKNPDRFKKDAVLFEEYLLENPKDPRALFYLAQSYLCDNNYPRCLETIEEALKYNEWDQERYMLYMRKAQVSTKVPKSNYLDSIQAYVDAYCTLPYRAEAIYDLVKYFYMNKKYAFAILIGKDFVDTPKPHPKTLFADYSAYTWKIKDLIAGSHFHLGEKEKAKEIWYKCKECEDLPENERIRVLKNIERCFE